ELRLLRVVRKADRAGAPGIPALGDAVRRRRARNTRLSEPRAVDVRVGSSTDALTPISVATRSLAARLPPCIALGLVVGAAVLADQVTKHIVAGQLALDDSVHVIGPFSIHHVQNSGIAFGLFSTATALVTALTALAVGWMLVFFARSGARHPVLPVALGLLIGGSPATFIHRVPRAHLHHCHR